MRLATPDEWQRWIPPTTVRCWRCGAMTDWWPYYLCEPCTNVVSPEEIAWMEDEQNQPGVPTWEMVPMGKEQGR